MLVLALAVLLSAPKESSGAEVKPEVSFTPSWSKIFTKETVTLTCNVASTARGHQGYSWYKDGFQINTKHSQSFTIKTAHVADSGNYQCETTSRVMSEAVRLDVISDWLILQVPYSVIEGDSLALRCHAWGDTSVKDTTFYKDSVVIKYSARDFVYLVPSVNMDTGGTYRCETTLTYILSSYTYTDEALVSVQALFSSPEINVRQYPMIEEGGEMTIRCDTNLNPRRANTKLEFAFYQNTRTVQGFGISSEYQVNRTGLQHAGDYTCEVKTSTNTVKRKSPVLNILIHELFTSPQIETTPSEIATAGDKITIKCTTDPATLRTNDRLLFAFYKDSQIVQEFSTSGEYHVAGARLQDTGDYTCAVKTQDGKVWKESPNLKISVQPQPVSGVTVQVQPTAGEVIAGQRLEVLCSVDKGTGPFKYSWCNQDTGSCETHQTEAQQHQFIVEPVTEKYDGLYYCSVSRDGTQGARSNSVRISVRVGVSQPLLTLSVYAVAVGDDVGLQCESQRGSFPIHYRFYHKDKGLGDVTANQNGAAQLSVTITSLSMSGDYYCDSRNEVSSTGQRSKEIALSVMEPVANARISTDQEVLEVVAGDTLNLTCSMERGTSPTFLWLHNETEADKSSGLYQISEPGDVLYVRSLQSLHGGRYQCQASNQVSPNRTFSVQSNILNINISGMSPTLRTSLTVSVTVTLLLLILVTAILLFKCRQTIGGVFSKAPVRIAQRPEKKEMLRPSFPTVTPAEDQLEYSNLPARHDTTGEELTYASVDVSRIQKASPAENDGYFVTYSVLKAVERTVDTKAATNIETPDPSDSVYENFNSK